MNSIKAKDVTLGSTVELILHHNYPLEIIRLPTRLVWKVSQNKGGAKSKYTTHFIGLLMAKDLTKKEYSIFGGPYAGQGLGKDLLSHGQDYTASATIPWNYIMRMWSLEQKEIPDVSQKHGRMNIVKTAVKF